MAFVIDYSVQSVSVNTHSHPFSPLCGAMLLHLTLWYIFWNVMHRGFHLHEETNLWNSAPISFESCRKSVKNNSWWNGKKKYFFLTVNLYGSVVISSSIVCKIVSNFIPSFSHPILYPFLFLICHYLLCFSGAFGGFGTTTTTAAPAGSTFSFAAPSSTTG